MNTNIKMGWKGAGLGCFAILSTHGVQAADVNAKQAISSIDANLVTTQKDFGRFKVEVQAPADVDVGNLLRGVNGSVAKAASDASNESLFSTVNSAIDAVRSKDYPQATVGITLTNTGSTLKSTSGYVDLYQAFYWWNKSVGYNGSVYAYNYYVNTSACFMRNQYGTWAPSSQSNGTWTNLSWIYSGGLQTMGATGYDNYKGCLWYGKSSSNKGDFVMYFFN